MQVHRPNFDYINEEAERIKKRQEESGFEDRDLNYYDWKNGDNNLRLLPPWSAKGWHFLQVFSHFELPPDKKISRCMHTWANVYDTCYICEAIDKVLSQFPELDLGRISQAEHWYGQVIDRDDEASGIQIVRFTPPTRNWVMLQMANPKIGDVADIETGFDINFKRGKKARKKGPPQVSYDPEFVQHDNPDGPGFSVRPTVLHEDPEVVARWIKEMYDLERIYGAPNDEKLAEIEKLASRALSFYTRKYADDHGRQQPPDTSGGNGAAAGGTEVATGGGESAPATPRAAEPPAAGAEQSLDAIDPKTVPTCFAGLDNPVKHDDNSVGFNDNLEKCLLCKEELRCMDAKQRRGL
jgi:hypothetical protein